MENHFVFNIEKHLKKEANAKGTKEKEVEINNRFINRVTVP